MVGGIAVEIIGQNDFRIFDEPSAWKTAEWDKKVIQLKTPLTYQDISSSKNVTRVYHSTKTPLLDSAGNVVAIVGISRDATQAFAQKAAQELNFAVDFSHEFKTPLTVLQNAIDLESNDLAAGIVRPEGFRRKLLKNRTSAVDRLRLMVDSLKI